MAVDASAHRQASQDWIVAPDELADSARRRVYTGFRIVCRCALQDKAHRVCTKQL